MTTAIYRASVALRRIQDQLFDGKALTLVDINNAIAADPVTAKAFAEMAALPTASVEEVAKHVGFPIELLRACVIGAQTGGRVVGVELGRRDHPPTKELN